MLYLDQKWLLFSTYLQNQILIMFFDSWLNILSKTDVFDFWNFIIEHTVYSKKIFYRRRERVHLKVPNTNWVLGSTKLFHGNNTTTKKFESKKYRIYKIFIFSASSIICLVALIEGLELNFRYDFVENFMALLYKKEFVLGDVRNRNSNKNTEIEFTVNFSFLWNFCETHF